MTPLYTAVATATGDGRDGKVRSSDGLLETAVATPVELGGAGGATNPEQLFAAGYAACFHSALRVVARRAKVEPGDTEVTAQVGIGRAGAGFGLAVTLEITMPGLPADTARQLVEAAHQVCPYSNATRGNIDVQLVLR
ncbi:organic hydroperoxide resistance protein [Catellatospora sp. IY07-71]|uniref:organic hydroperoxide resistance protein n=1 Tax=Catellatospora sp. IY07-71 TaxID=2728827 RepID=UPI001BB360CD|nr:organic hydroperoxide resistance protein [Catellatospora sp. IY07-71]